jgi:hypothetical protein
MRFDSSRMIRVLMSSAFGLVGRGMLAGQSAKSSVENRLVPGQRPISTTFWQSKLIA